MLVHVKCLNYCSYFVRADRTGLFDERAYSVRRLPDFSFEGTNLSYFFELKTRVLNVTSRAHRTTKEGRSLWYVRPINDNVWRFQTKNWRKRTFGMRLSSFYTTQVAFTPCHHNSVTHTDTDTHTHTHMQRRCQGMHRFVHVMFIGPCIILIVE